MTPLTGSPHPSRIDGDQVLRLPCDGFEDWFTRATLHLCSSRSPPRPPGEGASKASQNAASAKPQPGTGSPPPDELVPPEAEPPESLEPAPPEVPPGPSSSAPSPEPPLGSPCAGSSELP